MKKSIHGRFCENIALSIARQKYKIVKNGTYDNQNYFIAGNSYTFGQLNIFLALKQKFPIKIFKLKLVSLKKIMAKLTILVPVRLVLVLVILVSVLLVLMRPVLLLQ